MSSAQKHNQCELGRRCFTSLTFAPRSTMYSLDICSVCPSMKVKLTILQLLFLYVYIYLVYIYTANPVGRKKMHIRLYLCSLSHAPSFYFLSHIKMFFMTKENYSYEKLKIKKELNLDFRILTVT